MDEVDLMEGKFKIAIEEWFLESNLQERKLFKLISSIIQKTFGSLKQIVEDKPKTPLPSVNVANAVEIAVS